MIEAILSIIATALGLVAEKMRRKWKAEEKRNAELEETLARIHSERNRGWDNADAGRVFNAK